MTIQARTRTRAPAPAPVQTTTTVAPPAQAQPVAQPVTQPTPAPANGGLRRTIAPAAARQPAAPAVVRANTSWMTTGQAAREKSEIENARAREAAEKRAKGIYMPLRFWTPVGAQREIIVLDTQPGPCVYEHQLQNPSTGKWNIHELCPKEWEPCPLCAGAAAAKESYYVMFLSVIDLTPWGPDKHNVMHEFSRMLLPVKAPQQGFFLRQFDRQGTLRGTHLLQARDSQQAAAIGNSEFIEVHSEEEIMASFGGPPKLDQQGKMLRPANADCFPFDYGALFPRPSGEDLRRRYTGGGGAYVPAGSRQETADEWGDDAGAGGATTDPAGEIPMD